MNADSESVVFVLDQDYTVVGDNGLTAKFTFNPISDEVFTNVRAEIVLEEFVFDFRPANGRLITGETPDGLDILVFVGTTPYLFDENGEKWAKTEAEGATFVIEVIMERNGADATEIRLALYRTN